MDIVLLGHHKEVVTEKGKEDYIFPLQESLMVVLYLDWKIALRITEDYSVKDEIFGELPYFIFTPSWGPSKFITRDNIPRFLSTWTTINNWLTESQKKSWDWIEHFILHLDPSFKVLPENKPTGYDMFESQFYRLSSAYSKFLVNQNILQILSDKLSDKLFFYDEYKIWSTDILAYYWLKQQMLHEQLGYNKNSTENIEDSFPKLFKFCERMDIIMKKLNTAVALYKNRKEPTINIKEIIEVPEELLHFEWK